MNIYKKILRNQVIVYFFIGLVSYLFVSIHLAFAGPQSTTYEIKQYDLGSGGISGDTSTTYSLFGNTGQIESDTAQSTTYQLNDGLTYLIQAAVPVSPTLSTPASNYDRIKLVINTSSNPNDTLYAIQLSTTSNFSSNIFYVKSDSTIGTTLASTDFQTYSTWGGASGIFVTGLTNNTTYYFRVKARQGNYSETQWGPSANITTNFASLTFSLSSSTLTFNNLNAGNSYTDSTQTTTLTTSTNAYNGYVVYGKVNQALKTPDNNTIANYSSTNASPTTWSGTGFGYNTNDTSLTGGTANRFSGSKYAGFTTSSSTAGDPVADNPGPVQSSQISGEQFTISYRITVDNTTPAGTYTNVILYTIAPTF